VSSPIGTQITQAVGFSWAAKMKGDPSVSLVYFGEGATSSSEFHNGLNFAGVFKTPTVFLCRNNGWAISVPVEKQTGAQTFAQKGFAYGVRAVRVDGNDLLAVYKATRDALDRARRGEGPTLIEALTHRLSGHSTSDDPKAYRKEQEMLDERRKDPLPRLRAYLERAGLWDDAREKALVDGLDAEIKAAVESAEKAAPPPLESLFDEVYATRPPRTSRRSTPRRSGRRGPRGTARTERWIYRLSGQLSTGDGASAMPQMNMVQAINDALRLEMQRDDRVVILGEDVGKVGGVFRVTQGLYDTFGGDRVIDTPLSEGGIIGAAIGMALYGLRPVPEIQFSDFIFPAFDQIVSELAKYRLPLGRRVPLPHGDSHAGGRRHPRRALPLAVPRGVLHPHAGPQGGVPEQPLRRQGPAPVVAARQRPGALLRAQAGVPRGAERGARGRLHRAPVAGQGGAARLGRDGARVGRDALRGPGGRQPGRGAGRRHRGGRPAHALAARPRHHHRVGEEDRPRGGRARGAQELRLRRRAGVARQRARLPAPGGAAGARDGLRHALPVHPRDGLPAPRGRILPALLETARF
jgi:hypothetical protein